MFTTSISLNGSENVCRRGGAAVRNESNESDSLRNPTSVTLRLSRLSLVRRATVYAIPPITRTIHMAMAAVLALFFPLEESKTTSPLSNPDSADDALGIYNTPEVTSGCPVTDNTAANSALDVCAATDSGEIM